MADKKNEIIVIEPAQRAEPLPDEGKGPEVGQWFWVKPDKEDGKRWLGCIVHVGSNHVQLEGVSYRARVHFDDFHEELSPEPEPDAYIDGRIKHYQDEANRLMGRVKELTARLGVAPSPELTAGSETAALARVTSSSTDMGEYKAALVKAKEDQLPNLFARIGEANKAMSSWMTAKLIPLKAQADGMRGSVSVIEDRIFSVELYAGLSEEVVKIADGEPASLDTKVHLLQRRCYMDEECLAEYRAGGMDFQGIGAFDAWLVEPENRDRLLPFERCAVAFQVRRRAKDRDAVDISDFIRFSEMEQADKWTFLYLRNGEQVFRMHTSVRFEDKLFPDPDRSVLNSGQQLWAKKFGSRIDKDSIITDNEYQGMREEEDRELAEWEAKMAQREADKAAGKEVKPGGPWHWRPSRESDRYVPFTPSSVYYDDIGKVVGDQLKQHNRIALILQGLLDRSEVFHPHPPWQIWTQAGFEAALELIFDSTRALTAGEKPDFEVYRARLNKSLKKGSVTVGQDDAWELHEGRKEAKRMDNDYRTHGHYRPTRFRPYGNPGPGVLAKVSHYAKKAGRCTYAWFRERLTYDPDKDDKIRTTFTCPSSQVLNVDAYTPGDFRDFFDDPRTREEYLKWAPLLLEAEEYHAGNRVVAEPAPKAKRGKSSWEGRMRYQRQKRRKELMGKAVRLTCDVTMRLGKVYKAGSLWRVTGGQGSEVSVVGITESGDREVGSRFINNLSFDDIEVVEGIPDASS